MKIVDQPKMHGTVTVGERGQVVIPSRVRKQYKIKAGDKLFVVTKPGAPIGLIPAEEFSKFLEHAVAMLEKIRQKQD